MKQKILSSCVILLIAVACQQIASTARAAVTFSVTPSAVSNFYAGTITLQINGLNTGETVQIDKFLDANGNGVIDAADLPVQSFQLTDGQASVIGGVTNLNVPGDVNSASGVITAPLNIASDIVQELVAQYLFRLSSPTSRFTPVTNVFNVTNSAYAQSFTGVVRNSSTNVPNAIIMVAPGTGQHGSPFAGVMADTSGNYTLNLPVGTYSFWLFKSNYVADLSQAPVLTLTNGATITTNLSFLVPATNSISGYVVDAANANLGLPDIFMVCETPDRQLMAGACYTGTNGAFSVPVIAGQWGVSMDSQGLGTYGYLGLNNSPQVDTTTGNVSSVTLALPKGTALFYGSVLDSQGHPLAGIDISCSDNNDQFQQDYYTDTNGYFVAPVVGGLTNDGWQVEVSSDPASANYVFAQPSFDQNGGTNLDIGQALLVNFPALLATNQISGYVTNSANQQPVANVGVYAYAPDINGLTYDPSADTDSSGHYVLNVASGTWYVGLNCSGGNDSLEGLGFQCVDEQSTNIVNANALVNFTVEPSVEGPLQITTTNLPAGTVGDFYSQSLGAAGGQPPYSWWLPGGTDSLPPGQSGDMSFSSDGTISGTPSTAGTYTFWVGVSDNASPANTVTQQVSLTINAMSDVASYYVVKQEAFLQVAPASLVLNTNFGPFNAYVGLVQSSLDVVPLASVILPTGVEVALPWGSTGIQLQTQASFPNQAAIDAAYPPGDYTFGLYAVDDGLQFPVLSMPSAAYPNAPQISNYAAAQAINPLAPFTLQWGAIPGATASDYLWVFATDTLGNKAFGTPSPATDPVDALSGTVTSVVIPTNTFQPGQAYTGWITIFHTTSLNTTEYPGATGLTIAAAVTSFPLTLASASPTVDQPTRLSDTQFGFRLSGIVDQNYTVQVSTNLASTNWHTLLITNLSASPAFIQDNQATNAQRFYRVELGP